MSYLGAEPTQQMPEVGTGTVETQDIQDGAVTAAKLAAGAAVPSQTGNANKFLTTDGTTASWGIITPTLKITAVAYPDNDTAVDPAGAQTITITGVSFASTPTVYIGGTIAPSVTFVSSTTLTVTTPAKSAGTYDIYVVNPDGATAIRVYGISYSGVPTWTTAAGSLGTLEAAWTVQLQATSNSAVTYALTSGSTLPSGVTLSSSGLITGTGVNTEQTFNFSVTATDLENQDTPRSFSITISLADPYFKYTTLLLTGDGAAPETKTYTVTNSGASDYLLNGVSDPTITLVRGSTYIFNVSASGHPFWIKTAAVTGTASAYSTGVTNNGTQSGTVTFIVPSDAPATLYYICQFHGSMVGTINVVAAATQNNTFKDSSVNNITLTRNGNTAQGTFTPYGSNWSNYFKGSGDYLSNAGSGTTYDLTGDFCVEGFFNFTSLTDFGVWGIQPASGLAGLRLTTENNLSVVLISGGGTSHAGPFNSSVAPIIGQWNHIAVTRSGSAITLWLNGVSVATGSSSSWTGTNLPVNIGMSRNYGNGTPYYMNGYISNFRVVKGSPVYTSTFTPPTTALTAITNTQLLACQSNRFKDNTTNNFTLTPTGTPSVQRLSPFNLQYEYSTAVYGGSAHFTPTNTSGLNAGTTLFNSMPSAFTLEAWVYPRSYGTSSAQYQNRPIMAKGVVYMNFGLTSSGALQLYHYEGNTQRTNASTTIVPLNAWSHVVASVSAGTITFYINGQSSGTATWYGILGNNTTDFIGYHSENSGSFNYFDGYLSDVRYAKSVIYSSNFTPPTAPLSAVATTEFLLSGTNSAIYDNAMMNNLETVGNAQISTSVKKYGTGSIAFDGAGDYLVSNTASSDLYTFGTGDFTIEFWLYLNSTSTVQVFYDGRPASGEGLYPTIYTNSSGTLAYYTNSNNRITGSSLSANTWYHIAVSRSGSSTKMFVNGTQTGSTYTDSANYVNPTSRPMIGADGFNSGIPGGNPMNGYIDDLRVTKGYARYTATFTPPTTALKIR